MGKAKSCLSERITSGSSEQWDNNLGISFAEKGLGVLVNYLTMSHQYTFTGKKANNILAVWARVLQQTKRGDPCPFLSIDEVSPGVLRLSKQSDLCSESAVSQIHRIAEVWTHLQRAPIQTPLLQEGSPRVSFSDINSSPTSNLLLHSLIERLYEEGINSMISL